MKTVAAAEAVPTTVALVDHLLRSNNADELIQLIRSREAVAAVHTQAPAASIHKLLNADVCRRLFQYLVSETYEPGS